MQGFEMTLQDFAVDSRISSFDDLLTAIEQVSKTKTKTETFINTVKSTFLSNDNDITNKIYIVFSDNLGITDRKHTQEISVQDIESSNADDIIYFLSENIKFKFDNINETVTAFQITPKTDNQQETYFTERILSKMHYN